MFYRADGSDAITPQSKPTPGTAFGVANFPTIIEDTAVPQDIMNQLDGTETFYYGAGTPGGTYNQGGATFNQPATGMGPMSPYQGMNPMQGMMYCCPCPMMYGLQQIPMQNQNMQVQAPQGQPMTTQTQGNYNRQLGILPFLFYGLAGGYNDYNDDYYDDYNYNNDYEYYEPEPYYNNYDDDEDDE